ncbi:hypothetical protein D9758_011894 [Tetrapyrgos nigripes]|uniref:LysM domain-containing protein n=1 Tax=Tetrapyrgos nigripes TaxID=182062 RepID=A0A8H5CPU5_9AGAR|nr:hypothetical protein D9758_011894 [Tetrapyrgos nigripes]
MLMAQLAAVSSANRKGRLKKEYIASRCCYWCFKGADRSIHLACLQALASSEVHRPSMSVASTEKINLISPLWTVKSQSFADVARLLRSTTEIGAKRKDLKPAPRLRHGRSFRLPLRFCLDDYDETIAPKVSITVGQLYAANPGLDWDDLQIGFYLNIPCKATSASSSFTTSSIATSTSSSSSATSSIVDTKTCSSPLITKITDALSQYQDAKRLCSTILGRSVATPNVAITSIVGQTATTTGFATELPTSLTISSGSNTVSQTTTTTPTITTTGTSTITTMSTVSRTVTDSVTTTSTFTLTPPVSTTTVISYTFAKRRPSKSNLGDVYPDTLNSLKKVDLDNAKTACNCFLRPVQTSTATSFITQATTGSTQTVTPTTNITVPAGTVTSLSTVTVTSTISTTILTTANTTTTHTTQTTANTTTYTTVTAPTPIAITILLYHYRSQTPFSFPKCLLVTGH